MNRTRHYYTILAILSMIVCSIVPVMMEKEGVDTDTSNTSASTRGSNVDGAIDGDVLWTHSDPRRAVRTLDIQEAGVQWPARPGPVAVGDLDGDGRMEVLAFMLQPGVDETHQWAMAHSRSSADVAFRSVAGGG